MTHDIALPSSRAPELRARSLGGSPIDIASERPAQFSVIFFYRGVQPDCSRIPAVSLPVETSLWRARRENSSTILTHDADGLSSA